MDDAEANQGGEEPQSEHALEAAGVIGTWEWDHRRQVARYNRGAAELLAGDAALAGRDLTREQALAGVYDDDLTWLRSQLRRTTQEQGVMVREHRVHSQQRGIRRVLCRGRTFFNAQGDATVSAGIVIDITEFEADGRRRFGPGEDDNPLHAAAEHGVAAYEALEASGQVGLLQPARTLLMAIGREIARRMTRSTNKMH